MAFTCTASGTNAAGRGGRGFFDDGFEAAPFADEEEIGLGQVLRAEGAVLWYEYDFGDDWRHRIEVEKIAPAEPGVAYPRCTGGRRAAPPADDIGGIWGLEEIVYLVAHPEEDPPDHLEDLVFQLRDEGYDPGAFDPADLHLREVPGRRSCAVGRRRLPHRGSSGRDEASAVTELLDAVAGTDVGLAPRRVAAISALTMAKLGDARDILRDAAVSGPDGSRHVAAGVLAGLGEESSGARRR
jgi:hypothetical protein